MRKFPSTSGENFATSAVACSTQEILVGTYKGSLEDVSDNSSRVAHAPFQRAVKGAPSCFADGSLVFGVEGAGLAWIGRDFNLTHFLPLNADPVSSPLILNNGVVVVAANSGTIFWIRAE